MAEKHKRREDKKRMTEEGKKGSLTANMIQMHGADWKSTDEVW